MMKLLYFECFSGISGDMTLAALVDLGVPKEYLISELSKLGDLGFEIGFETVTKNGITANSVRVNVIEHSRGCEHEHEHVHKHSHHHEHRSHAGIVKIINDSGITFNAKKIAKDIFLTIAEAEAKVHGQPVDDVHFHEVGAVDSIVDIVGTAICIDYLKPDAVISSPVNDGHGFTHCQHGMIPVPVPAVSEIFAAKNAKTRRLDIEGELVTPTGAGIVATLAGFDYTAEGLSISRIGYGAGTKDLKIPNVLRVCLCESHGAKNETAAVIETNIDNQTPESIAFAMEKLFLEGALDVFFAPIYMKKNRPAVLMTVICKVSDAEKMCSLIFENTSTIGVRMREEKRVCLSREIATVQTRYGEVDVKTSYFGNYKKTSPEFESAKKAALLHNVPLDEVYSCVYEGLL